MVSLNKRIKDQASLGIKVRPYLKKKLKQKGYWHGSHDRESA
jgi:hypothetical protein